MASYLERYLAGERERVWDELVALGAAVREEPMYADALAVARETMRRARANIEMLIPRLVTIGYQFGYGWIQPFVRERLVKPYRVNYSGRRGEILEPIVPECFSVGYRIEYYDRLELAQEQPPLFVPATDAEEQIERLDQMIADSRTEGPTVTYWRSWRDELRAKPSAAALVAELESSIGTLLLSVRAWYEIVGGVNFVGDHPGWRELLPESVTGFPLNEYDYLNPMHVLDPLFIFPLDEKRIAHYRTRMTPEREQYCFTLAEDDCGKYLDGTRRYMEVASPNAAADGRLIGSNKTFVQYLRACFRWGGFPGWERIETRPERDLAFLTEGLLPL